MKPLLAKHVLNSLHTSSKGVIRRLLYELMMCNVGLTASVLYQQPDIYGVDALQEKTYGATYGEPGFRPLHCIFR